MEEEIKKLKQIIADAEETLKDTSISSDAELVQLINDEVESANKKLAELQSSAEKNLEAAKADGDKADIKDAKQVLAQVESLEKKVEKVVEKAEKIRPKQATKEATRPQEKLRMDKAREQAQAKAREQAREQARREAARKMPKKASSPKKMIMPKNVMMDKLAVSKRKIKAAKKAKAPVKAAPVKAAPSVKAKVKTARAFGQVIEYKNDVDFCAKLKAAFKKRRAAAKSAGGKRRKTKPVFGVITNSVKNAVSKALHSVSTKEIEKNPKQFLAKAERLEKSAMRFLEDFKSILGNDFKKSNITSEFGELEKAIKQFVAKIAK
jgi:colicin import membrane protein